MGTIAGGAALDVFEVEPPLPADSPLWSMPPHVLVSPHMSGGDYVGFEVDMMGVFVDNLRRWLRGERLHNIVDPAWDTSETDVFRRREPPVSITYRNSGIRAAVLSISQPINAALQRR